MILAISWQQSIFRAVSIVSDASDPDILSGSECFSIQGIDHLNCHYRCHHLLRLSKMRLAHGMGMAILLVVLELSSVYSVEYPVLDLSTVSSAFLFGSTNARHLDYQHCYA